QMVNRDIEAGLGETAYAQYRAFQKNSGPRDTVAAIATRLSYGSEPWRDDQARELLELLKGTVGWHPGLGSTHIDVFTDAFLDRARSFMSPIQVDALERLCQEQQASVISPRPR